jgi:HK97 gp10 family phage protein
MTVEITGMETFMKQLGNLTISPETAKRAVNAAADIYVERLQPNIPVSDGNGHHVRDELTYKPGQYADGSTDVGFTKKGYYGRFLNNGTAKMHDKVPPGGLHFMEHTYDEAKEAMQQAMFDEVRKDLE